MGQSFTSIMTGYLYNITVNKEDTTLVNGTLYLFEGTVLDVNLGYPLFTTTFNHGGPGVYTFFIQPPLPVVANTIYTFLFRAAWTQAAGDIKYYQSAVDYGGGQLILNGAAAPQDLEFTVCLLPPSPSPSVTATPSVTRTPSATPSHTPSPSPTASPSLTPTPSRTPSETPSITPSRTPSSSATPSTTATPDRTPSPTSSTSPTASSTPSVTPSASVTPSVSTPSSSVSSSASASTSSTASPLRETLEESSSQEKSNYTIFIIAGASACSCLAITASAVVIIQKKRTKREVIELPRKFDYSTKRLSTLLATADLEQLSLELQQSIACYWEIEYTELVIQKEIGQGAFGTVFKAEWRNSPCAVKQIDKKHNSECLLKEVRTIRGLKPHPNICSIFGVCTNPSYPISIVLQYCNGGQLKDFLRSGKATLNNQTFIKVAKDIANGMSHIHRENILHLDLACRNLLVSVEGENFCVKVSDFGLSRVSESGKIYESKDSVFPIRWSAPEVLKSAKLTRQAIIASVTNFCRAADVWSYGIVLWEMIDDRFPYEGLTNQEVFEYVVSKQRILPAPESAASYPPELYTIMKKCWCYHSSQRPSFDDLQVQLKELQKKYCDADSSASSGSALVKSQSGESHYGSLPSFFEESSRKSGEESTLSSLALYGNKNLPVASEVFEEVAL